MLNLKIVIGLISLVLAFLEGNGRVDVTFRHSLPLIASVESVAPAADEKSSWQLRARLTFAENCDVEPQSEITYYTDNIDIQMYRDIPSTIECGDEKEQFEIQLTLADVTELSYLIINDRVWKTSYAASSETGVRNLPSLNEMSLFPVWVGEADTSALMTTPINTFCRIAASRRWAVISRKSTRCGIRARASISAFTMPCLRMESARLSRSLSMRRSHCPQPIYQRIRYSQ